jgi:hypothetical protein
MQENVERNARLRANSPIPAGAGFLPTPKDEQSHLTVQTSPTGQRFMPKREVEGRDMRPAHTMSDKMRGLFTTNAKLREAREEVNPLWHNFPTRCVQPITSVEEMQKLLQYHGQSDNVMVVRYWQEGCMACNALDKIFEWACHEQKKRFTKIQFFDVQKEAVPKLTEGMLRYPQVKAFSAGQWADMDFKPPQDFRESMYQRVEREVHRAAKRGQPINAVQAEEMYYSVAGPATAIVLEESIMSFYNQSQVRLHNYWKQISLRRSWYYKKYVEPIGKTAEELASERGQSPADWSIFGETWAPTLTSPSAAPNDIPNATMSPLGSGFTNAM